MGFCVGVSLSGQYEHLHTILQKTFLSVSVSVSVSCSVNTPWHLHQEHKQVVNLPMQNGLERVAEAMHDPYYATLCSQLLGGGLKRTQDMF